MRPIDREAFERAIEMARRQDPATRTQIDEMLKERSWLDAARQAVYSCQFHSLHLKLWQPPPCWVDDIEADLAAGDDGNLGRYAAARLLKRMLAASLSRYEPDPITALEGKPRVASPT